MIKGKEGAFQQNKRVDSGAKECLRASPDSSIPGKEAQCQETPASPLGSESVRLGPDLGRVLKHWISRMQSCQFTPGHTVSHSLAERLAVAPS